MKRTTLIILGLFILLTGCCLFGCNSANDVMAPVDPVAPITTPMANMEDLCDGDFVQNCRDLVARKCGPGGQGKAAISNGEYKCSYQCGAMDFKKTESCTPGGGSPPIAACLWPACPDNCLSCEDLYSNRECIFGTVSDDPDAVGDTDVDWQPQAGFPSQSHSWNCQ